MRLRCGKRIKASDSLGRKAPRKLFGMSGKALHPDHAEFFASLGRRIKELRRERGWALRDMVLMHGYHVSQWQKFEKGCPVTVDSLLRMATVFNLTLNQLIGVLGDYPQTTPAEAHLEAGHAAERLSPVKKAVAKRSRKTVAK